MSDVTSGTRARSRRGLSARVLEPRPGARRRHRGDDRRRARRRPAGVRPDRSRRLGGRARGLAVSPRDVAAAAHLLPAADDRLRPRGAVVRLPDRTWLGSGPRPPRRSRAAGVLGVHDTGRRRAARRARCPSRPRPPWAIDDDGSRAGTVDRSLHRGVHAARSARNSIRVARRLSGALDDPSDDRLRRADASSAAVVGR